MKKTAIMIFLLTLGVSQVYAATRVVRQDGSGGAYTTIQAAVTAAVAGDTVSVEDPVDAVYDEMVTINKNLIIADNSVGDVTLTKSFGPNSDNNGVLNISAGTVLISGFTIVDASGAAIDVSGTANVTVQNCWISGCDGEEGALGGTGDAAIDLFSASPATLTMIDCTVDDSARTGHKFGPAVAVNGHNVRFNALRCRFVTDCHVGTDGPFDSFSSGITCVFGAVATLTECVLETDSLKGIFIALSESGFDATVNLNRCLIKDNPNTSVNYAEKLVDLNLNGSVLNATNTIFDANDQQTDITTEACIVIGAAGNIDLNYCTLVRGANGIFGIGNPTTLRVANSLIGQHDNWDIRWIDGSGDWDVHLESNHFWGSLSGHYPGFGGIGTNANFHLLTDTANTESTSPPGDVPFPGGDPAAVNYQIQTPGTGMTDLGVSTLLGTTADDFDEVGVRPRGAGKDKGAQEGQGPVATPTPEPTLNITTLQRQLWDPYR